MAVSTGLAWRLSYGTICTRKLLRRGIDIEVPARLLGLAPCKGLAPMGVWCVDELDLAAVVTAVSCSRHFVRVTLTQWGAAHMLDDALIVASELVTNAVKATGIIEPDPRWGDLESLALLTVRLIGLDTSVVIEVWDVSPEEPRVTAAAPEDEEGHGLAIVSHLAKRWGSYPHRGGKVVWAELAVSAWDEAASRAIPDPSVLVRVINRLRDL